MFPWPLITRGVLRPCGGHCPGLDAYCRVQSEQGSGLSGCFSGAVGWHSTWAARGIRTGERGAHCPGPRPIVGPPEAPVLQGPAREHPHCSIVSCANYAYYPLQSTLLASANTPKGTFPYASHNDHILSNYRQQYYSTLALGRHSSREGGRKRPTQQLSQSSERGSAESSDAPGHAIASKDKSSA
jgi:hypothetical protein